MTTKTDAAPARRPRAAVAVIVPAALAAALTGCATKENCDPSAVGNVFQSAACAGGGAFRERREDLSAEIAQTRSESELSRDEIAALERDAADLARDRDRLARTAQGYRAENASARLELSALRADNRVSASRIAAAQDLVGQTEADAARLEQISDTATEAEIAALIEEIEVKRRMVNDLTETPIF